MDYDKLLQMASGLSNVGAAMDPYGGMASRLGASSADATQAVIMQRQMKKAQDEEEKRKKAGTFRRIGSSLGQIVGGPIGSTIGSAAGQKAAGQDIDFRAVLMDAATNTAAAYVGNQVMGQFLPQAMPAGSEMLSNVAAQNPNVLQGATQGSLANAARSVAPSALSNAGRYAASMRVGNQLIGNAGYNFQDLLMPQQPYGYYGYYGGY